MKWDSVFGERIRKRGEAYYLAGKVKGLQYQQGTYHATVSGTRSYQVKIHMQEEKIQSMSCTCPMGGEGVRCKHMAAVLIAIEHQRRNARIRGEQGGKSLGRETKEGNTAVFPFAKEEWNPRGEYFYFDLSVITESLHFTKETEDAARQLIRNKAVCFRQMELSYPQESSESHLSAKIHGQAGLKSGFYPVTLEMSAAGITGAQCEVPGCPYYYSYFPISKKRTDRSSLCIHQLALLHLAGEYIRENNPGDSTDREGLRILERFRSLGKRGRGEEVFEEEMEQERVLPLELVPRLEETGRGLQTSFRIGYGKNYLIKNLSDLVEQVKNGETVTYGKKLTVDFRGAAFGEKSQSYFDFIRDCVEEERDRNQDWRNQSRYGDLIPDMQIKGSISLHGSRLDRFLGMVGEEPVEYLDTRETERSKEFVELVRQKPQVTLQIKGDENKRGDFLGIRVEGELPVLRQGSRLVCFKEGKTLGYIERDKLAELLAFYENPDSHRVRFRVGRRHLSEFYYGMLPRLREIGKVEEPDGEKIQPYLPPEAVFRFYLDAPGQNVTCRVEALYQEQAADPMDFLREKPGLSKETFRDENREGDVLSLVFSYFPYVEIKEGYFHCGQEEDKIFDVLAGGVSRLMEMGEVHSTDRFRHLHIRRKPRVTLGVSLESDVMNLEIHSEDVSREELLDMLAAYRQKKKYFRLKNGDFMKIDGDGVEALKDMMNTLHLDPREFVQGKMQVPKYRALYLDQMLKENEALYGERDTHFRKLIQEFKAAKDPDYEIPARLKSTLRKYQRAGYQWLRTLDTCGFGGILADDMGLGKTLQTIALLEAVKAERPKEERKPALIICPASLVYNWEAELSRFAPDLKVLLIVGGRQERKDKLALWEDQDVLVTSYDLLKRDIAEYQDLFFDYQILDEAQYIKNHNTSAAKAVKVVRSKTRYALTGTPIENRLSELWSIFDYLMPGFLYDYETFRRDLEIPITKEQEEEAGKRLHQMVSPFILRRLKSDVLEDLPEKLEETQYARMGEVQQKLYDAQVLHMKKLLEEQSEESFAKNKMQILAELTRIRQICCDPSLFLENYEGGSAKREACLDRIRSAIQGEHKILVFSQFTSMLELLGKDLEKEGIPYYRITGGTPKEQRMELVRRFNQDDTPVFLISLRAGGTGLNLVGADVVIHYDPWWNLAVQNQATDRAHRIGQRKVVSVYQLIIKDSIEEKIQKMQEAKKSLSEKILQGEMGTLGSLSREELLALMMPGQENIK